MSISPRTSPAGPLGFTVLLCQQPRCHGTPDVDGGNESSAGGLDHGPARVEPDHQRVRAALGHTVRSSPHGVLLLAECLFGACRTPEAAGGLLAVVQPCVGEGRDPCGPPLRVGPIRTEHDLTAVCRWLRSGPRDAAGLPWHLLRSAPVSAGGRN